MPIMDSKKVVLKSLEEIYLIQKSAQLVSKTLGMLGNPILGHITTFGGHPVISQAGLTTLKITLRDKLFEKAKISESKFRARLKHRGIVEIRGKGLMLALILKSNQLARDLVIKCLEKGLILFWLLYESKAVRITPPLNISENEIEIACDIIVETLEEISN